ncbi:MAG: DUF4339 domain-containing protein [Bacteroidia bacterium]|nr:DUF4339 domain-containing protein [Bacteroidia bacterium]
MDQTRYYYTTGTGQAGPFTPEELRTHGLTRETLVWAAGMESWRPAGEIPALADVLVAPPPLPGTAASPKRRRRIWVYAGLGAAVVLALLFFDLIRPPAKQPLQTPPLAAPEAPATVQPDTSALRIQAEAEARTRARATWRDHVTAEALPYTYSALGGISDLRVTLTNQTEYPFEHIVIAVDYIQRNGAIYKTEEVRFVRLGAASTQTLPFPDSPRGVRISQPRITAARSDAMELVYRY